MGTDETYSIKEMLQIYFDEMKKDLREIKEQTTKTNGRVTSLEGTRIQVWTAIAILLFLGGSIITLSIMAIDSKIEKAIETSLKKQVIIENED